MGRDPSLKLAAGEFRDHKYTYLAIIIIVALSMTVFTTQSAMNQYNDYVTMRSVGMFYGDGVVTTGGTTIRNILSGASEMTDARQIAEKINQIPGFKATPKAETEGAIRNAISSDAVTAWGVDLKTDESVCDVVDKIIEGSYFDTSKNYTQTGMGNPLGATVMHSPTLSFGIIDPGTTRNNNTILPYPIIVGKTCAAINNFRLGTVFRGSMLTEAAAVYCDVFFEVIGIYETDKPLVETLFYVVPIESAQEIHGWDYNTANYICIDTPDGMSDANVREALAPVIGDRVFYSRMDLKNALEGNLNVIGQTILNTTIIASLLLATAAVKFVMDSIIIRKSREIGTLKALGARDRVVVKIFLYQAIFIGLLAGGLGLAIAAGLMKIISAYGVTLTYSLGAEMKVKFILTEAIAATAIALPLVTSILASILPCRRVASLSPVEAIRRGDLQGAKEQRKHGPIEKLGAARSKAGLGPFGLAINEMHDHLAIYAVVVLVIGVALSVFTLQASYQHNLEETVTTTMKETICADGMILGPGTTPRAMMGGGSKIVNAVGLAENVSSDTGYAAVARSNHQGMMVLGSAQDPTYEGASVWGINTKNDELVFSIKKSIIKGGYFDPNKDYSQNFLGEQAQLIPGLKLSGLSTTVINEMLQEPYPMIIGDTCAKAHNLDIGSPLSILFTDSEKGSHIVSAPFVVIGIYETGFALTDSLLNFVPREAVNQMAGYNPEDGNAIVVKAPSGTDYADIYEKLNGAAPQDYESFSWHEAVVYMIGPAFDAMLLIIYTAIAMTLTLAAVIIKYAMDSTVDRKTREIGTLKAFGARDNVIIKIFIYQGIVIGILSGLAAVLLSSALAYIIVNVIHLSTQMPMGMILQVGFSVTGTILIITLVAPLVTAIVAASLPSRRAARLSPVEAIRKGELNQ
ncbi:MAG: FtsX-like permease family protein [Candidatus Thermoplasmatota archaeon]|nr:FtsX-like permease family protein [Candidatus Thermoplasmatota archaeon]